MHSNSAAASSVRRRRGRSTINSQLESHRTEIQVLLDHTVSINTIRKVMLEKYSLEATPSQYKRIIGRWTSRRIGTRAQVRAHEQVSKNTSNDRIDTVNSLAADINASFVKLDSSQVKTELSDQLGTPDRLVEFAQKHQQTRRIEMTLGQWTEVSVMLISLLLKGDLRDELLSHLQQIVRK